MVEAGKVWEARGKEAREGRGEVRLMAMAKEDRIVTALELEMGEQKIEFERWRLVVRRKGEDEDRIRGIELRFSSTL